MDDALKAHLLLLYNKQKCLWLSPTVQQDDAQWLVGAQALSFFIAPRDNFDYDRCYINKDHFN